MDIKISNWTFFIKQNSIKMDFVKFYILTLSKKFDAKISKVDLNKRELNWPQAILIISPNSVWVDLMVCSGSSMVKCELKYMGLKQKGLKEDKAPITLPALSRNKASKLKRIKKECMELEGARIKASPLFKPWRLSKPTSLLGKVFAISALSARIISLLTLIIFIPLEMTPLEILFCDF